MHPNRRAAAGLLISVLVWVVAGCGNGVDQSIGDSVPDVGDGLIGTAWVATSLRGEDLLAQTPPTTLVFDAAGQVNGSAGCNDYAGTYEAQGSEIALSVSLTTRRPCQESQGIQESRFIESLQEASRFEINADRLSLTDATGGAVASFKPA